MSRYVIPPITDVEPVVNIKPTDNGITAEFCYTDDALNEMVRRINKQLDEELMARLAKQHGYAKERTGSIVECDEVPCPVCSSCGAVQSDDFTAYYCWSCGVRFEESSESVKGRTTQDILHGLLIQRNEIEKKCGYGSQSYENEIAKLLDQCASKLEAMQSPQKES